MLCYTRPFMMGLYTQSGPVLRLPKPTRMVLNEQPPIGKNSVRRELLHHCGVFEPCLQIRGNDTLTFLRRRCNYVTDTHRAHNLGRSTSNCISVQTYRPPKIVDIPCQQVASCYLPPSSAPYIGLIPRLQPRILEFSYHVVFTGLTRLVMERY